MRSALKRAAERALLVPAMVARRLHAGRAVVLAYHDIVPDGEPPAGDRSLHLGQRAFADQLDQLLETHEVVALDSLGKTTDGSRPRAVITIDDAYAGAVSAGVDELVKRRLPATIFVAPGLLDGATFWWDELADPATGLDDGFRAHALITLAGDAERIRAYAAHQGLTSRALPGYCRGAAAADVVAAAQQPGITLGGHSWSHANMAAVDAPRLETEMTRPLAWLRERTAAVLPWCAYPYGLESAAARGAARAAGYLGAFLVEGGWLARDWGTGERFALPRLNIPAGVSLDGFALRLSGLMGS